MKHNLIRCAVSVVLLGSAALAYSDDGRRVLADFEACKDGDVIAPGAGATAKPWRRFGAATTDNILATTTDALAGKVSATYPLTWPARFGAAVMVADEPLDLSSTKTVEITAKSDHKGTLTKVLLQISDGKTTFQSKTPQAITDTTSTLKFDLSAAAMVAVDGPAADFSAVSANVQQIGFKVVSDGSTYSEHVIFDDLAVSK